MRMSQLTPTKTALFGVNPSQYLKFIEYMDNNKQESEVCSNLAQLCSPHLATQLSELSTQETKTLAKLYNKYGSRLIPKKQSDQALSFIEMAQKLISKPSLNRDGDAQLIRRAILNNSSAHCYRIQNKTLDIKLLEKFLHSKCDSKDYSYAIGYNNLATIHISNKSYEKAVKYAYKAILLVETDVLDAGSELKKSTIKDEKLASAFISKLKILLIAYLNLGIGLEKCRSYSNKSSESQMFESLDEKQFYEDGYKLSSKYFGKDSILAVKFNQHLAKGNKGNVAKEFKIRSKRKHSIVIPDESKVLPIYHKKSGSVDLREFSPRLRSSSITSIEQEKSNDKNGRGFARRLSSVQDLEEKSICEGLKLIIHQQKVLEEKVAQKFEDTIQRAHSIQQHLQTIKEKELNLKIEMLKRGKDEIIKHNLELESKLEKLRSLPRPDLEKPHSVSLISPIYFTSYDVNTAIQTNMQHIAVPSLARKELHGFHSKVPTYTTLDICQSQKPSDCGSTNDFNSTQITQAGSDIKEMQNPTSSTPEKVLSVKKETPRSDFSELSMSASIHDQDFDCQILSLNQISSLENQFKRENRERTMSLDTKLKVQNRGSDAQTLLELQEALSAKESSDKHGILKTLDPNNNRPSLELYLAENQQKEGERVAKEYDNKFECLEAQADVVQKKSSYKHEVCVPQGRSSKIKRAYLKQFSHTGEPEDQKDHADKLKQNIPKRCKENECSLQPETTCLGMFGPVNEETDLRKGGQSNFANSVDNLAKSSKSVEKPHNKQLSYIRSETKMLDGESKGFGNCSFEKENNTEGSPSKMVFVKKETFGLVEPPSPHSYHQNEGHSHRSRFQLNRMETPQLGILKQSEAKSGPGESIFKRENKDQLADQYAYDGISRYAFGSPLKNANNDSESFFGMSEEPAISTISKRDSENINSVNRIDSAASITNLKDLVDPINIVSLIKYPDYLQYPSTSVISKQAFLQSPNRYMIECHLESKENSKTLTLLLKESPPEIDQFEVVAQENIPFKDLQKILKHLDCRDSLPSIVPLKSIKTYGSFIRHIIMPFIGIGVDEDEGKRIEIWEKPCSLFKRFIDLRIFGELCLVNFQHISGTEFRLVLTNMATEKSIWLDISLDQVLFKRYMTEIPLLNPSQNPNADLDRFLDIFSDEDATAEELLVAHEIVTKYEEYEHEKFEILSVKLKNEELEEALYDQLSIALTELESFLISKHIESFDQIASDQPAKYIRVKLSGENHRKCAFYLQENNEKSCVEVFMKNFFLTHAPEGKRVKAEGHFEYKFDSFWKDFGVIYPNIDSEDKKALLTLLSDHFNLEVQEKPLELENYETYEANPIIKLTMDCGVFKRYFIGEGNKYPVTLSLIGIRGHPQGVKATVYNPEECLESGVLFLLQPSDWIKPADSREKTQRKRFTVPLPMKTDYNLCEILNKSGFDWLNSALCFNKTHSKADLLGIKTIRSISRLDLVENYINPIELIKLLRKSEHYFNLFSK